MSIKLTPGAARLTVLGSGWSSSSVESGDGLTEDGKLWEDIAGDLGYDFGDDVDWDQIAGGSINWSDVVYEDFDGNIYTDLDGDGIYADPNTGNEAPEDVNRYVSEEELKSVLAQMEAVAKTDEELLQYAIHPQAIQSIRGGKVSSETSYDETDPARPHQYSPAVYYIQRADKDAYVFLDEQFYHKTADNGSISVISESVSIRGGSSKRVYYSSCSTNFTSKVLPNQYKNIPIAYLCWQCIHGSFYNVLVSSNENTITTDQLEAGDIPLAAKVINGKTYYLISRKGR